MKKFLIAAAFSLAAVACLSGCGGGSASSFTTPGIQSAANASGSELTITLAEYTENINYVSEQNELGVPKIDSLNIWGTLKQDSDQGGALTYRITEFEEGASLPSFIAAVYDSNSFIKETRVGWDAANAQGSPDIFRNAAIVQIMATTGIDQVTAGIMYDTIKGAPYTSGSSKGLTYACNGNYRAYYLISGNYHLVVVEPFTDAVRTEDLKDPNISYFTVTAAGAVEMQHPTNADNAAANNASGGSSAGGTDSSGTDANSNSNANSDASQDDYSSEGEVPSDIPDEAYAYDDYGWYDVYGNYTEW